MNKDVNAGAYTLAETGGPSGYTASTYSCVVNNGAPVVNNSLTLALGDNAICTTINNNDNAAHLKLVKTVTNDNGGSAAATAWTLTASGPTALTGLTGTAAVDKDVNAGAYMLAEAGGPSGYTASLYSCVVNSGAPVVSNSLTLALGDNAVCTINNDDKAAHLQLVKTVTNDNGGSAAATAWTLTASGPTALNGVTGTGAVNKEGATPASTCWLRRAVRPATRPAPTVAWSIAALQWSATL